MISCSHHQWMFQFHFWQWRITARVPKCDSKHVEGRKCKTHPIQTGSGSRTRRTQEERQHLTPLWLKLRLDRKCLALYCGVCCSPPARPVPSRPTQRQPAQQHSIPNAAPDESFPHLLHKAIIHRCWWFILLLGCCFCFVFLKHLIAFHNTLYLVLALTHIHLRHNMLVFCMYLFKSACL